MILLILYWLQKVLSELKRGFPRRGPVSRPRNRPKLLAIAINAKSTYYGGAGSVLPPLLPPSPNPLDKNYQSRHCFIMKSYRQELWFQVPGRRAFINITPQVEQCLRESGVKEGLVLCNAMHIRLYR
jgi:hypothetical protein